MRTLVLTMTNCSQGLWSTVHFIICILFTCSEQCFVFSSVVYTNDLGMSSQIILMQAKLMAMEQRLKEGGNSNREKHHVNGKADLRDFWRKWWDYWINDSFFEHAMVSYPYCTHVDVHKIRQSAYHWCGIVTWGQTCSKDASRHTHTCTSPLRLHCWFHTFQISFIQYAAIILRDDWVFPCLFVKQYL